MTKLEFYKLISPLVASLKDGHTGFLTKIEDKDISSILVGLPEENLHCSVLAADTLRTAIEDYIDKKGGYKI